MTAIRYPDTLSETGFLVKRKIERGNDDVNVALNQICLTVSIKMRDPQRHGRWQGGAPQTVQTSGQRRGITRPLKAMIKRRSAIKPTIGHMKIEGRLGPNPLKGALGDALHAVLCGAGHNLRLLIKKLRLFCADVRQVFRLLIAEIRRAQAPPRTDAA